MSDVLIVCPNALNIKIHPIFDDVEPLLLNLSKKRNIVGLAAGAFVPPAEILSLASYLIQEQISVTIVDLTFEALLENDPLKALKEKIEKEDPSIIGVRAGEICFIDQYKNIHKIIKDYNQNILSVVGGVAGTGYFKEFLFDLDYDVVVRGEGELTFLKLCKNFLEKRKLIEIDGIVFKKNGKCKFTNNRKFLNMNELLLPARQIYPLRRMYEINGGIDLLFASRGCPNNCSFCNAPMFWRRRWRGRSPEDIVRELKLIEEKGAKIVHIHDLNFGVNKKWLREICNLIKKEKIDILWDCQLTVKDLDKDSLKILYGGGCRGAFIGIESASQISLDGSNKSYAISSLKKGLLNAKDQGIHIDGGYVVGLPDDDLNCLKETKNLAIDLLRKDLVETPIYFLFNPWKGSYVGDDPEKYGIKIENKDLRYYHGFSSKPICSTKHVDAKTVYSFWESGWYELKDILKEKI